MSRRRQSARPTVPPAVYAPPERTPCVACGFRWAEPRVEKRAYLEAGGRVFSGLAIVEDGLCLACAAIDASTCASKAPENLEQPS